MRHPLAHPSFHPPTPLLQVLYPTLSDYDIRYYVMEILKVDCVPGEEGGGWAGRLHGLGCWRPATCALPSVTRSHHDAPPNRHTTPFHAHRRWTSVTPRASCTVT